MNKVESRGKPIPHNWATTATKLPALSIVSVFAAPLALTQVAHEQMQSQNK